MDSKRKGRPRKLTSWTAELLQERAREYFERCDRRVRMVVTKDGLQPEERPEPYSIEGLCVYLDITRKDFERWRKQDDEIGKRAEKIHLKITANRIAGALDGTQNSSFAQFMLKNTNPEEYREKVEVETSVSAEVAELMERSLAKWEVR